MEPEFAVPEATTVKMKCCPESLEDTRTPEITHRPATMEQLKYSSMMKLDELLEGSTFFCPKFLGRKTETEFAVPETATMEYCPESPEEVRTPEITHRPATVEQLKCSFLTKLEELLDGSTETHGEDVLEAAFVLCRACKQMKMPTTSVFSVEELERMEVQMVDSLSLLNRDLQRRVNVFGLERAQYLRVVRSGLEFIKEEFAPWSDWLEDELEEMMSGRPVTALDKKLKELEGDREEYDFGDHPVDLLEVPESHTWWSEMERDDSQRVYGSCR